MTYFTGFTPPPRAVYCCLHFRSHKRRPSPSEMIQRSWYVAQFFGGRELDAARRVNGDQARAFCPLEVRRWSHRGKVQERQVPVLSGYVFVEMVPNDPHRWHDVAACPGFYGFIGGAEPVLAAQAHVEGLLARTELRVDQDGRISWVLIDDPLDEHQPVHVERGAAVRITFGSLENCVGQVEWVRHSLDGVVAQVTTRAFFGIEMRVEIPVRWLAKLGNAQKKTLTLMDLPVKRQISP